MKLFEVKIYECAVSGLFARPERWRYTNMAQYERDIGNSRWLHWGEGRWKFTDGKAQIYDFAGDCKTSAEIVGEIPVGRHMEPDRFEPVTKTLWRWDYNGSHGYVEASDDDQAWQTVIEDTGHPPGVLTATTWTREATHDQI